MLWLKRLKIVKLRDFAPTELEFHRGINVLLGRNATGKTTLLELIAGVLRGDLSAFDDELEIEAELRNDESDVVGVIWLKTVWRDVPTERPRPDNLERFTENKITLDATYEIQWPSAKKRFCAAVNNDVVEFDRDPNSNRKSPSFEAIANDFFALYWAAKQQAVTALVSSDGSIEHSALHSRNLGPAFGLVRYDESLQWLTELEQFSRQATGLLSKHRDASEFESKSSPLSFSLVSLFGSRSAPAPLQDWIVSLAVDQRFHDLKRLLRVEQLEFVLRHLSATTRRGQLVDHYGDCLFRYTRRDGSIVPHVNWSYGERRLLGYFLQLAAQPEIIVCDELVNGFHHEWIEASIDLLGKRQAFFASQNPLLLDYLPIVSLDDVRTMFVRCERVDAPKLGRQCRNFTEDEAARFWSGWQAGVQHVSEILRTEGLY